MTVPPMRYRHAVGAILWAACFGCAGREAVYRDVRQSRTESFKHWQSTAAGQKTEDVEVLRGKLDVAGCVDVAIGNNKNLMMIVEEREKAKGQVVEAMSYALPTATLTGTYRKTDKVPTIEAGPLGAMTVGRKDNLSYGVDIKQPIFTGGATSAAIRGARIYQYLADERIRGAVQQVVYDARKGYYDALLETVLLEVAETSLKVAQEHFDEVKKRRANGVASDFDVLRAQVEVSNFGALVIQKKNMLHIARTSLFKVMGVSQESEVTLTEVLEYQPAEANLMEVVEKALSKRPDLYQAELEVRLQKESLKIAQAGWLPKVFLFADWERAKPNPVDMTDLGWGEEVSGGVKTEFPIFDGLKTLGRVMQEKATLRQKQTNLKDTEERALLETRQAYLSLKDATEFVESQRANLGRAEEGFRLARVGYQNGVNTQVEVMDAQQALTVAKGNYYRAVYDHMVAKLMLEKATGELTAAETDAAKRGKTAGGGAPAKEGAKPEKKKGNTP